MVVCRGTHLKRFQSVAKSRFTILQQGVHLTLAEEVLDLASVLLCFKK
jgi:hypothetical protein